jgi:hypothetical protein
MAQGDGDREHLRPLPRMHVVQRADQVSEEVVGIELLDDQLHQRTRPGEVLRACGKDAQHAWAHLVPPSLGIELLFGPEGLFEVAVDVVDEGPDLAHGCSSTEHDAHDARVEDADGLRPPARCEVGVCYAPGS